MLMNMNVMMGAMVLMNLMVESMVLECDEEIKGDH